VNARGTVHLRVAEHPGVSTNPCIIENMGAVEDKGVTKHPRVVIGIKVIG
jgi:hypothetical protein